MTTKRKAGRGKFASVFTVPQGTGFVVASDHGLLEVFLPARERRPDAAWDEVRELYHGIAGESDVTRRAADLLGRYFAGEKVEFDMPLDTSCFTRYQKEVCRVVAAIGYGEVRSYREVAADTGNPGAARGVGSAMARNPLPVVIPCHRVLGSGGALTGYSGPGGLETKKELLKMEGALSGEGRCRLSTKKSENARLCTGARSKKQE